MLEALKIVSSLLRSMFSMFTCFTDGCTMPDGTPFVWYLWDTHGPFLVFMYVVAFMFICFGVLNMIMAVVVENTIRTAAQHDAERLFGERAENLQKARKLHALMIRFCNMGGDDALTGTRRGLWGILDKLRQSDAEYAKMHPTHLQMQMGHEHFEKMMKDPDMSNLLEDLNISYMSRSQLFEILDIDGNGLLSIPEVVDGIMKLRGPPDKGDMVAMFLCIKDLQAQLSKLGGHKKLIHS